MRRLIFCFLLVGCGSDTTHKPKSKPGPVECAPLEGFYTFTLQEASGDCGQLGYVTWEFSDGLLVDPNENCVADSAVASCQVTGGLDCSADDLVLELTFDWDTTTPGTVTGTVDVVFSQGGLSCTSSYHITGQKTYE